MPTVKGKRDKTFKINLDDVDREAIEFVSCKGCVIQINFEFRGEPSLELGYNRWLERPVEERPRQLVVLRDCENMKLEETFSLETNFVFINCKDCTVKITNSDESMDVIGCNGMHITAVMISTYRVYTSDGVHITCNEQAEILQVANTTPPAITRRWDVEKVVQSGKYEQAMAMLQLADNEAKETS